MIKIWTYFTIYSVHNLKFKILNGLLCTEYTLFHTANKNETMANFFIRNGSLQHGLVEYQIEYDTAFQAVDPGSIPGRRNTFLNLHDMY